MTDRQKQRQLHFLGFLETVDGIWGEKSRRATEEFQREFGIGVDGVFGPNTMAKSREVVSGIQKVLVEHGERWLTIDGLAGPDTMTAMMSYQRVWGLTPSGIAGKTDREQMEWNTGQNASKTVQEDWWQGIRHFTPEEFRCKCGRYCDGAPSRMGKNAVQTAEAARRYFGRPGIVVSGLRCKQHNAHVGGVVNSQHLYGEAVDLRIEGVSADELLAFLRRQKGVRYAYKIDATNVHFDVPKGER